MILYKKIRHTATREENEREIVSNQNGPGF